MGEKNLKVANKMRKIGIFGGASSGLGILGLHNVCHAACEFVIVALGAVGIVVAEMPLLFLQDYSLFFSIIGIASAAVAIGYYIWKKKTCGMIFGRRQNLWLIFNIAVLVVSFGSLFVNFGIINVGVI